MNIKWNNKCIFIKKNNIIITSVFGLLMIQIKYIIKSFSIDFCKSYTMQMQEKK